MRDFIAFSKWSIDVLERISGFYHVSIEVIAPKQDELYNILTALFDEKLSVEDAAKRTYSKLFAN